MSLEMFANEVCVQSINSIFLSVWGIVASQATLDVHGRYKIVFKQVQMALKIVANEVCVQSINIIFFEF